MYLYPHLRDDQSIYLDIWALNGENFFLDCQHGTDCNGSKLLSAWNVQYSFNLANLQGKLTLTLPGVPSFKYSTQIKYGERSWNRTVYSDEQLVYERNWNYEYRKDASRDLALNYDFVGKTADGYGYSLYE